MLVLPSNELLHARVGLVDVSGNGWFGVFRVIQLVDDGIAVRSHVLFAARKGSQVSQVHVSISLGARPLTSTWSADQLSMVKDLTLEICVPNLRCNEAHRIQRKTPNCTIEGQLSFIYSLAGVIDSGRYVHSNLPILENQLARHIEHIYRNLHTWIRSTAISASVIARNSADEILESPFVAQLLALANAGNHDWSQASKQDPDRTNDSNRAERAGMAGAEGLLD